MFENLSVDQLKIHRCKTEDIEPHTFDTVNAKTISIIGNSLATIKKGVFTDSNLHTIYLKNNKIQHIEAEAFSGMKNLCFIDLGHNPLGTFDPAIIGASKSLKAIDISNIGITEVNRVMFNMFPNLEVIVLANNRITKIGNQAFVDLKNLYLLDLSLNRIKELSSNIFPTTSNLANLYINNNNLTHLSHDLLEKLSNLNSIMTINNPWSCSCHKNLKSWIEQKEVNYICHDQDSCVTLKDNSDCIHDLDESDQLREQYKKIGKMYDWCRTPNWQYVRDENYKKICK